MMTAMLPPFPLLSCNKTSQLSDFIVSMVPKIWNNGTPYNNKRYHAFKLFCQRVLKATHISVNCILISLFYIYKLRFAYPNIKGSMGSEIRLFTTALVLANKFLDDNTFTNKAWSQISSIPIRELNIMEIEFLSALNYTIYIDSNQFYSWTIQCQQWSKATKRRTTKKQRNEPYRKPIVIIQHDFKPNRILSFQG